MAWEEYEEIKQATAKILKEYNVKSPQDWDAMDEEDGSVLYENLKAGVMEEFGLDDDEMGEMLEEVFKELSET